MTTNLVLPDGVRLAHLDELPGAEPERSEAWARVQTAVLRPGYVLTRADDPWFAFYGEANVDAPKVWGVFRDLCRTLLGEWAVLVMSEIDEEPKALGSAEVARILSLLESHEYQLAHDGCLQFGLVHQEGGRLNEVFVAPTKHFRVWLNDEDLLRSAMRQHGIPEVASLQFLDEYPRVMSPLPPGRTVAQDADSLIRHLGVALAE